MKIEDSIVFENNLDEIHMQSEEKSSKSGTISTPSLPGNISRKTRRSISTL
jgi:hypothetical protein